MAKGKPMEQTFEGVVYPSLIAVARAADVDYYKLRDRVMKKNMTCDEAVADIRKKENKNSKDTNSTSSTEAQAVQSSVDDKVDEPVTIISDGERVVLEEFKCNKYGPTHICIDNPKVVVDELKHMSITNINLIDFENMADFPEVVRGYINRDNTLNIFFYHAGIYSNDFFNVISDCNNINLQVLIYASKDQLVDHLISYYLGALTAAYPDKRYTIISRDSGYYPFIESLGNNNIRGVGYNYIGNKEGRYKYALCRYISNNKLLSHRNCIKKNEFDLVFKTFIENGGDDLTEERIIALCDYLVENNLMEVATKGDFTMYKFKMDSVAQFLSAYS